MIPFLKVAELLEALPEDQRLLVSNMRYEMVAGQLCGCALGALMPEDRGPDDRWNISFTADLHHPHSPICELGRNVLGITSPEILEALVSWVEGTNDGYFWGDNSEEVCRERYTHMCKALRRRAVREEV